MFSNIFKTLPTIEKKCCKSSSILDLY